jgi:hypothetical protein
MNIEMKETEREMHMRHGLKDWESHQPIGLVLIIAFDRYHAFMALNASARDIAKVAVGRGTDWRGSPKHCMAERFAQGDHTLQFDELVRVFGLK